MSEQPDNSRDWAGRILALRMPDAIAARIQWLLDRNNCGQLTPEERNELESVVETGQFLDLLHAKAWRILRDPPADT